MSTDTAEHGEKNWSDELILIPEGDYSATYRFYETRRGNGDYAPKVYVYFGLKNMPNDAEITLARYYNVRDIYGSPRTNGLFRAAPKGELYRDYTRLFGKPPRSDRLRLSQFHNNEWIVRVRTVTHDGKKRLIPTEAQYSVICAVIDRSPISCLRQTSPAPVPTSDLSDLTLVEDLGYLEKL